MLQCFADCSVHTWQLNYLGFWRMVHECRFAVPFRDKRERRVQ